MIPKKKKRKKRKEIPPIPMLRFAMPQESREKQRFKEPRKSRHKGSMGQTREYHLAFSLETTAE
jgi:hypothetical protein